MLNKVNLIRNIVAVKSYCDEISSYFFLLIWHVRYLKMKRVAFLVHLRDTLNNTVTLQSLENYRLMYIYDNTQF